MGSKQSLQTLIEKASRDVDTSQVFVSDCMQCQEEQQEFEANELYLGFPNLQ